MHAFVHTYASSRSAELFGEGTVPETCSTAAVSEEALEVSPSCAEPPVPNSTGDADAASPTPQHAAEAVHDTQQGDAQAQSALDAGHLPGQHAPAVIPILHSAHSGLVSDDLSDTSSIAADEGEWALVEEDSEGDSLRVFT